MFVISLMYEIEHYKIKFHCLLATQYTWDERRGRCDKTASRNGAVNVK